MSDQLLERERHLDALTVAARHAAGGGGQTLVIEGPAGIGKTGLMDAGRRIAAEIGVSVLDARGAELERDFGFGVVRQLFEPPAGATSLVHEALTDRARPAAALLDVELPGPPIVAPVGPDAPERTLNALYWLTVNIARRTPVALLVDDAHWADPASLRFLAYLAHRLESAAVLLVVAVRPGGEPQGTDVASLLGARATILRPDPLGPDAAAQLVRRAIPDADEGLCRACLHASGGNPFFLLELTETVREAGLRDGAGVPDVVPLGVIAAVRARVARLALGTRDLADAIAVLGPGALLRHAALVAGLGDDVAAGAADELTAAAILAPGRPLRFMHPLLRSAVYEDMALGARARAHERAARMLVAEHAPPERVAAHVLACEPRRREWVSPQLRAAAREGMRRGAPEAAVTYLRRALDEPPPADAQAEVLLELGEAEALSLDPGSAAEHLRLGIAGTEDPQRRLAAALLLAGILGMDDRGIEGVAVLDQAVRDSQDADPRLLARIEAHLANVARHDISTRERCADVSARVRSRARTADFDGGVELASAAAEEAMAGESAQRTADLARRAGVLLAAERPPIADFTVYTAARSLLIADRFDLAAQMLDSTLAEARDQRAAVAVAVALAFRCEMNYRLGGLTQAQADGEASLSTTRVGWRVGLPATTAILSRVLIERDDLDAAASAIAEGGLAGAPATLGTSYPLTMLLHARGSLRLAEERWAAALEDLQEVARRQQLMREPNPALMDWRSLTALALAQLDRRTEAIVLADEEVGLARRFGAPRALGIALRAAGIVRGETDGLEHLREAEAVLAPSPARLAHAHALASLGAALRRGGDRDAARDALAQALDTAHACGAAALEAATIGQLRSTGLRPRRPATRGIDALTPSERRAADRASRGLSNREIADELFVTVRTVEFHLGGAFRKLGVRSRHELAARLAAEPSVSGEQS